MNSSARSVLLLLHVFQFVVANPYDPNTDNPVILVSRLRASMQPSPNAVRKSRGHDKQINEPHHLRKTPRHQSKSGEA